MALPVKIAILCDQKSDTTNEQSLAKQLQLPLIPRSQANDFDFVLIYSDQGLCLEKVNETGLGLFRIDLLSQVLAYRQKQALQKELIVKAIGIKGIHNPKVWDACAGLGQDAMILFSAGCSLRLFERNPIVFSLLYDAYQRAIDSKTDLPFESSFEVTHANSVEFLKACNANGPDVIYIDPMYPDKRKKSKAKKAMQFFQQIVGKDEDEEELLALALKTARYRVVVKRPVNAPTLSEDVPTNQLLGKTVRFDIYALKSVANYLEKKKENTR